MSACHSVSRKCCTQQIFYMSLVADFRGLSISGRDLLAQANQMMPAESYRRYKQAACRTREKLLEDLIHTNNVVWWWDNYAHMIARVLVSKEKGTWTPACFTGLAFLVPQPMSPPLELARLYTPSPIVGAPPKPVTCMPTLSSDINCSIVDYVLQKVNDVDRIHFEDHFVNSNKIFNAPLKPELSEEDIPFVSLANFQTFDISEDYIGCKKGIHILLKAHVERISHPSFGDRYSMVMLDVTPFYQIMKASPPASLHSFTLRFVLPQPSILLRCPPFVHF